MILHEQRASIYDVHNFLQFLTLLSSFGSECGTKSTQPL